MSTYINYGLSVISCLLFWMIHLETDPTLGKVWIRPDSNGTLRIRLHNLTPFFSLPFQETWIWKPAYIDTNPYAFLVIGISSVYLFTNIMFPYLYTLV